MTQFATDPVLFPATPRPVETRFDLDGLTSDGGLLWLGEADDDLGLSAALAAAIPDWRLGSGAAHLAHAGAPTPAPDRLW
ncbi:MAG: hypothetical protein H0V47_10010, partial [Chloroflexia bacterium]|nr:hypothetical protein [Chloroflexia bacterium]